VLFFPLLIATVVLLAVTNVVAYRRTKVGLSLVITGSLIGALIGCIWPAFGLQAIGTLVAALVCLPLKPRRLGFLVPSLVATLGAYSVLSVFAFRDVSEWVKLRDQYPLESLEQRLAYEKVATRHPARYRDETRYSAEREHERDKRLESLETQLKGDIWALRRTRSLEHLHSSYVNLFINSEGFGYIRMMTAPSRYSLATHGPKDPELQPDSASFSETELNLPASPAYADPPKSDLNRTALLTMHDNNDVDFVNTLGIGYFRDLRHVAGFEPHQFQKAAPFNTPEHWKLQRIELVSLLKHEEPGVYVSEHLPRMQELGDAKTRPLDGFETSALDALVRGQDLQVLETESQIRMLGSIRAAKQCLSCHSVERGDLLGAFSYRLRRE
jgi:hypothetical protein